MDINVDDIVVQEEEVEDVKWATVTDIKKMIEDDVFLPPHIEFFEDCLKYLENK
ncbi:MAG: hypothetical protein RSD40_03255 [Bacilli bacterium]